MKNFIISILFSISIIALFVYCADDGDYGFGYSRNVENSNFAPELIKDKKLEPFFRNPMTQYYGDSASEQGFYVQNIRDWNEYFDKKIDTSTIRKLLYETKLPQIDTLIFFIKNPTTKISQLLATNNILKYDNKAKTLDFLFYLGYAKRCETFANYTFEDTWNYEKITFKGNDFLQKLLKGGIRQVANVNDAEIRQRYLFQIIRLHYFNEDYAKCNAYFESNKNNLIANSDIFYRGMGYAAAANYKLKNYALANYQYSLIFENCKLMQSDAIWSFHPQNEADFKKSIAMAKNKDEKATLYFMMGYYNDPIRAINGILGFDNNNKYLPTLLTRAINIEEENVLSFYDQNINLSSKKPSLALIKTVQSLISTAKSKSVYQLALGYLYTLSNDPKTAEINFKLAEKDNQDILFRESVKLYRAINQIQSTPILTTKSENDLLPYLKVLLDENPTPYLRKAEAESWLKYRMAQLYKKQGENLKAECWMLNTVSNYYEDYANLEKSLAFLKKENKTDYEKLLMKLYAIKEDQLLKAEMIAQVYNGNIEKGLSIIQQTKKAKQDTLLGNPFIIHIKDCHDCDHEAPQKTIYTILSFLENMDKKINESKQSQNAEQKAKLYFEIANGFYNITHFGNARTFYENYPIGFDGFFNFEYLDYNDNSKEMLKSKSLDCKIAADYYKKALESSSNEEFKTKCAFMLAKCEQNEFYRNKPKEYKGDFKSGKYFAELKSKYSTTKYYQEIIRECGYFATYLKKK